MFSGVVHYQGWEISLQQEDHLGADWVKGEERYQCVGREDQVPGQKDQNWSLVSGFALSEVIGDHVVWETCPAQQKGSLSGDPAQQDLLKREVDGEGVVVNWQSTGVDYCGCQLASSDF
jgi:hypothetical protein